MNIHDFPKRWDTQTPSQQQTTVDILRHRRGQYRALETKVRKAKSKKSVTLDPTNSDVKAQLRELMTSLTPKELQTLQAS